MSKRQDKTLKEATVLAEKEYPNGRDGINKRAESYRISYIKGYLSASENQKNKAVSFALWLMDSGWTRNEYSEWKSIDLVDWQETKTTEELYDIFLKSKIK